MDEQSKILRVFCVCTRRGKIILGMSYIHEGANMYNGGSSGTPTEGGSIDEVIWRIIHVGDKRLYGVCTI